MRKFGLIGYPLTHSFSQRYFTEKFQREGITDCTYSNFSIAGIGELPGVLADTELCGLNVTIPYKRAVLDYLHYKSDVVDAIGACNCIRMEEGRLTGYNTDVVGFEQSLVRHLSPYHSRALVLGTGGAAKAVEWVLQRLGIVYVSVTRRPKPGSADMSYEQVTAEVLAEATLIINTTPLGMYPHTEECPALPYEALTAQHYLFDLIYNPARTLFLRKGEERGAVVENGHEMLILQAEESWRIWTAESDGAVQA